MTCSFHPKIIVIASQREEELCLSSVVISVESVIRSERLRNKGKNRGVVVGGGLSHLPGAAAGSPPLAQPLNILICSVFS